MSQLRIEHAYLLVKKGQSIEAMELLRNFEPASKLQLPRGYFVMYQAACVAGDTMVAEGAKVKLMVLCSESLGTAVRVADEALSDCMPQLAVEILEQARAMSGDQLAFIVRLADAYVSTNNEEMFVLAADLYRSVLTMSPTNARARIGLGRVLNQMGRYHDSQEVYFNLSRDMPNFVTAQREAARLMYATEGRVQGDGAYAVLLEQAPRHSPIPHSPPMIGPSLSIDPSRYESHDLTGAISVERQAKAWKDWRPTKAIGEYQSLISIEPSNQDAYFDLGQQYSTKNRTRAAMGAYSQLLDVNPCHYAAGIAMEGTSRKLEPRGTFDFLYFGQSGRNGLANINRLNFEWGAEIPFGDEDEYLRFEYSHLVYDPKTTGTVLGNSFGAGIYDRFLEDFTYFAEMDVQTFDEGFKSRPVFDVGVNWDICCDAQVGIGGFLENVAENSESIRQDIYMGGGRLSGHVKPLSRWDVESQYRFIGYSDHNFRHDFFVHNKIRLHEAPNELNMMADYDFLSFDEDSIFGPGPGIFGTVHPYFAPSGFSQVSLGFEWKHHFSRFYFDGAPQRWASIEYRAQWDSQGQFYNIGRVKGYCDIYGCLGAGAEAHLTRSGVYNNDIAYAYLILWFP